MEYILIFIIILWFLFLAFFSYKTSKKLNQSKIIEFKKILNSIEKSASEKEKIIDLDKLYHKILLEFGYKWSFWDILKQKPIIIKELNKIWELHKVRNKLAHDFDNFDEKFLSKTANDFIKEINILLK